tara:strand:- start:4031 stop:4246 length:216 start_codon:yes stop_codon:yes gene_type:complete
MNSTYFVENHLEEIVSELARVGRPDLINLLMEHFNMYGPWSDESDSSDVFSSGEEEFIAVEDLGHGHCVLR